MTRVIKSTAIRLLILFCAAFSASAQTGTVLPPVQEVVAKMLERDAQRQAEFTGYTATRRYIAVNRTRRAEMLVQFTCSRDGVKEFTILSEQGSNAIRKHVFYKLIREEEEASRRGTRQSTRLIPANYDFQILRRETLETGPAYVLSVVPKIENKYLLTGLIWVDASDYSIVRIEGEPAKNPSFWVHDVQFVHTYQRVHQFWLASSTQTTSEVRFFGTAELTIENSGYALNPLTAASKQTAREASILQ